MPGAAELKDIYRAYIACLNARVWDRLSDYVDQAVRRNGEALGLAGYRAMLEGDVAAIPDLHFAVELLTSDPPYVASRLRFDCTPGGILFGLNVGGRRVTFCENVFYEFRGRKIVDVLSVIDKAAIEAQL